MKKNFVKKEISSKMYTLPIEIIRLIYEYDSTFSEIYSNAIKKFDYTYTERHVFNKWTGHHKYFLENGYLVREFHINNQGNYIGKVISYYMNRIWQSSSYNNGILHGERVEYHLNGVFKTKLLYENGKMVSTSVIRYFDNGNCFSITNYENGKRHGICKMFNKDSTFKSIHYYKRDKLIK